MRYFFRVLLLCLIGFGGGSVDAQNLKKPIKQIEEGDFSLARKELFSMLGKTEDQAGPRYLIALSYAVQGTPSIDSSYLYWKEGRDYYAIIPEKRREQLDKLGISNLSFQSLEYKLDSLYFLNAKLLGREQDYKNYLAKWPEGIGAKYCEEKIEVLQYETVAKNPAKANLEQFVNTYPKSGYSAKFRMMIDSLLFQESTSGRDVFEILASSNWPPNHVSLVKLLPKVKKACQARGSDSLWIVAAKAYKDMPEAFEMWTMAISLGGYARSIDNFFERYPQAQPREELRKWFEPWLLVPDSLGVHCLNLRGDVVSHLNTELKDEEPLLLELPCVVDAQKRVVVNRNGKVVLPYLPKTFKNIEGFGGENYVVHSPKDTTDRRVGVVDVFGNKILACLFEKVTFVNPYLLAKTKRGTALYTLNGVELVGDSMKEFYFRFDTILFYTQDSSYKLPLRALTAAAWAEKPLTSLKTCLLVMPQDSAKSSVRLQTYNYKLVSELNNTISLYNSKNVVVAQDLLAAVMQGETSLALQKGDKFGLFILKSEGVIVPLYDEIPVFYNPLPEVYITRKNGLYGFTSQDGVELTGHKFLKIKPWNSRNALCETDSGIQFLSLTNFKITGSIFQGHKSFTVNGVQIMIFKLKSKFLAVSSNMGTIIPARHSAMVVLPGAYQQMILATDVHDDGTQVITGYNQKGTVLFSKLLRARKH